MASRFWVGGTGTWDTSTTTHWSATSNGGGGASAPTAADDAFIDSHSGGGTITISSGVCRSLDCSTAPATTIAFADSILSIGDGSGGKLTLVANITTTSGTIATAGQIQMLATSTNGGTGWPITTAGVTLPGLQCLGAGGKWVLQDNLVCRSTNTTSSGQITGNTGSGTLDLNGKTVTCQIFQVGNGSTVVATNVTVNINNTLTATAVNVNAAATITGGSSLTIVINNTSTNVRTFAGGGKTFGTLTYTLAGSTGGLKITGANTFSTINFSDVTNARTLTLPASTTTTCTTFNVNGTASKLMSVISSTAATAATLSVASGNVVCDYLSLKDSTATGGATFYAGDHSTNVSGNTGWNFFALVTGTGSAPLGGLTATATAIPTVSATANAALGGLTAHATGVPTVAGTANAALGRLTASATGTPTVSGSASAPLGGLTAHATAVPTVSASGSAPLGRLVATATGVPTDLASGSAPLGALTATATGIVIPAATERVGGNLRRHLGNFPGRKELDGSGVLSYTLRIEGSGAIESTGASSLPALRGTGEVECAAQLIYAHEATERHTVAGSTTLPFALAASYTGDASEDEDDDVLVLLSI